MRTKKIKSIKFALLSPEEIRNMSTLKIISPDTYDEDGFPVSMGLMDTHLGVIEPGLRCKSCGRKVDECGGHFGHIELARPVIHVGYVKVIKDLLSSTCRSCGRCLLNTREKDDINRQFKALREAGLKIETKSINQDIKKITQKLSICPYCGGEQEKIRLDRPTTFREGKNKLTPGEVRERLEKISDDDLQVLGINADICRPEHMILTVLPVPPSVVRPSITLDSGDRSEDDLTHKLVDILRINQRVLENRDVGAPQLIVEDLWELLQYHVTTYLNNQTSGIPPARHRSGRALRTLSQRLKGKEGRFRSNLSGKRVNFSARTVISPDPYISINEVGVPLPIAKELTLPIMVNKYNLEKYKKMILNGPNSYPGINYIIRRDGNKIKVTDKNSEFLSEEVIEEGCIVERQMIDGDMVLFNRQPSLHRMSMMGHQVKVMDGRTFRLNLCCCPPYNADFDGDEMNLHFLQGEEARTEAKILMSPQEQLMSPRFGGPIIGAIHDHISGTFLGTYHREFDLEKTLIILASIDWRDDPPEPDRIDEDGKKYWDGRTLFSLILPDELDLDYEAAINEPDLPEEDGIVHIRNGKILSGVIDETSIGAFKGRILEKIIRKYGNNEARIFLDKATRMSLAFINLIGFSTGIDNQDLPEDALIQIEDGLNRGREKVNKVVETYNEGMLESQPGRSPEETLEIEIMKILAKARDMAGQIAGKHQGLGNSAVIMAKSGARGNMLNLSQMSGCIGQQAVRGERISRGYDNRTLSHFEKGELGSRAKGFVQSSFKKGLTPTEYFFHAMGGREGLVDTAVRTSRSGYMQRRLINALENLKLVEDGTVRETSGNIVQFKYGEDGIDPAKCENDGIVDLDELFKEHIIYNTERDPTIEEVRE